MSADQDRSLSSGISLPQWMKKNMEVRHDFDESAFSPPSHDDDFFYLRYSSFTKNMGESNKDELKKLPTTVEPVETVADHTKSCKQFIPHLKEENQLIKTKGIEESFYNEGAACGKSILAVAQQVLTGKYKLSTNVRGFTTDDTGEKNPSEKYLRQRRNSKSLPASPISSPVSTPTSSPIMKRKTGNMQTPQNRFFTGSYVSKEVTIKEEDHKHSWILSGILSSQSQNNSINRPTATSDDEDARRSCDEMSDSEMTSSSAEKRVGKIRAKPSELREMNFWSPTSM